MGGTPLGWAHELREGGMHADQASYAVCEAICMVARLDSKYVLRRIKSVKISRGGTIAG